MGIADEVSAFREREAAEQMQAQAEHQRIRDSNWSATKQALDKIASEITRECVKLRQPKTGPLFRRGWVFMLYTARVLGTGAKTSPYLLVVFLDNGNWRIAKQVRRCKNKYYCCKLAGADATDAGVMWGDHEFLTVDSIRSTVTRELQQQGSPGWHLH
ncbi:MULTISPECIES: hypothetical protein [Nocardia]|uniref:hypothetical protein n=1 Tax=Nocardia abscessus TaxID=120957 RepID=UPI0018946808|nr:hypothetical protein [Nocardia abscessus]MBF6473676.1 hypothetical protein [Nocardia abscessus]